MENVIEQNIEDEYWYYENPRTDCDNLFNMYCLHRRYELGDKHNLNVYEINSLVKKSFISKPIYLFDHGSMTIDTKPFNCKFDSGLIGFIFVNKDEVRKWFNVKKITKNIKLLCEQYLDDEINSYRSYLENVT